MPQAALDQLPLLFWAIFVWEGIVFGLDRGVLTHLRGPTRHSGPTAPLHRKERDRLAAGLLMLW